MVTPARFRRKPQTIEAVLYDGTEESIDAIHEWLPGVATTLYPDPTARVRWRNQAVWLFDGDWLARDQDGKLHVIDPDDLATNYEREGEGDG